MAYPLDSPLDSFELANALGLAHKNKSEPITHVAALSQIGPGMLTYSVKSMDSVPPESIVIGSSVSRLEGVLLESANPRLDFIRALRWLCEYNRVVSNWKGEVHPNAQIHPTAIVELGACIGSGCTIGPYTHIHSCVELGCNVQVGTCSVIGHAGFGYERDEEGIALHFPHFGQVIVEDSVTIGNQCSIARGNLGDTRIGSGVKMDDQVYIAHNVMIGSNTLLMSGCRLNGRVRVGEHCWIGTGALIREGFSVGANATVGMGSVAVRDVLPEKTVVGNPARVLY